MALWITWDRTDSTILTDAENCSSLELVPPTQKKNESRRKTKAFLPASSWADHILPDWTQECSSQYAEHHAKSAPSPQAWSHWHLEVSKKPEFFFKKNKKWALNLKMERHIDQWWKRGKWWDKQLLTAFVFFVPFSRTASHPAMDVSTTSSAYPRNEKSNVSSPSISAKVETWATVEIWHG